MRLASQEYDYDLNYGEIAASGAAAASSAPAALNDIRAGLLRRNPDLPNLMVDPDFAKAMNARQSALRKVVIDWRLRSWESRPWPSVRPWPISTPTAAPACPPT
jgi:6-phosphogluconate dehydrogenase